MRKQKETFFIDWKSRRETLKWFDIVKESTNLNYDFKVQDYFEKLKRPKLASSKKLFRVILSSVLFNNFIPIFRLKEHPKI